MTPLVIERLGNHDRRLFSCGVDALDRYLQVQASQDVRKRVANCYVAVTDEGEVAGFYTLSAGSVAAAGLSASMTNKLPRYPELPVALLGRLAVSIEYRGQRLASALLADAELRCRHADIAACALLVEAKSADLAKFYRDHGFEPLLGEQLRLFRRI